MSSSTEADCIRVTFDAFGGWAGRTHAAGHRASGGPHADGEASYLTTKVVYCRPDLSFRQGLPRARAALKGFRRLAPAGSRLPWPFPVLAMLVNEMARMGDGDAAVDTALAYGLLFRPSELLRVRSVELVPPP